MNAITAKELAATLGVSPRTIQSKARDRRIPHMRIGKLIRFTPQHVEQIQQMYEQAVVERRPEADIPNPIYRPMAQIVPMRRDSIRA